MRNNYTENHTCRMEKLEKKLYRYIEAHADLFTQVSELAEDLEGVKTQLKALRQEVQTITNHVKDRNSRVKSSGCLT